MWFWQDEQSITHNSPISYVKNDHWDGFWTPDTSEKCNLLSFQRRESEAMFYCLFLENYELWVTTGTLWDISVLPLQHYQNITDFIVLNITARWINWQLLYIQHIQLHIYSHKAIYSLVLVRFLNVFEIHKYICIIWI